MDSVGDRVVEGDRRHGDPRQPADNEEDDESDDEQHRRLELRRPGQDRFHRQTWHCPLLGEIQGQHQTDGQSQ